MSESEAHPQFWPKLKSEPGPDLYLFRVRYDQRKSPRTGASMKALVLETPDWANIVATTADGKIVLVRQFRFGTEQITLEIPGGMVDAGEPPLLAAQRELREETGYASADWVHLGCAEPNPAFHDNLCHHYWARDAELRHAQELDPGEDVEVVTADVQQVVEWVRQGVVRNSLVIAALARVFDLRNA